MLTIAVELLTGRYVATAYNARGRAEWPPHPARLFSALVAALPRGDEPETPDAVAALRWLERQAPPVLAVSDASRRSVVPVYVPVNDNAVVTLDGSELEDVDTKEAALAAATDARTASKAARDLDKARERVARLVRERTAFHKVTESDLETIRKRFGQGGSRQPRTFPSVTPQRSSFACCWEDAVPDAQTVEALSRLADRVHRLGHSSSLVALRVTTEAVEPSLVPNLDGATVLRVPAPGQLDRLGAAYDVHREVEPRVLPCAFVHYAPPRPPPPASIARSLFDDDWIVLRRLAGPLLPPTAAAEVGARLRAALLSHAQDPPPAVLLGHEPDGNPARAPHAAFVPLPFVGAKHADGGIRGIAVALPRALPELERLQVYAAVAAWQDAARLDGEEHPPLELKLGAAGVLSLERVVDRTPMQTLRPDSWTRPSRLWGSVTPIALDRNPGNLHSRNPRVVATAIAAAEETIAVACTRIDLPRPLAIRVQAAPVFAGAASSRGFPSFPPQADRTRRVLVHARIEFDGPVRGPLLLGAGRYFGLGLCRPLQEHAQ